MKSKLILLLLFVSGWGQLYPKTEKDLVFWLTSGSPLTDASGNQVKIQGKFLRRVSGPAGIQGKAYEFDYSGRNAAHFLKTNLDISPIHFPELTITLWVKPNNTHTKAAILLQGDDKAGRGLGIEHEDNAPCWAAFMGKKDALKGARVTAQWHFVAVIYNQPATKAWLVVNDEVLKGRTALRPVSSQDNFLTIGKFEGQIADLRVYSRMLTVEELSELAGKPLKAGAEDFSYTIRRDYKKEREEKALSSLDSLPLRRVYVREFAVYDTAEGKNIVAYLHRGDTLKLVKKIADYGIFEFGDKQVGRNSLSSLIKKTYPAGDSFYSALLTLGLQNSIDVASWRFWLVILIFAIGLFAIYKYFERIDDFFVSRRQRQMVEGARKGDAGEQPSPQITFFRNIFPVRRYRRWTFLIGFMAAATLFVGSLFDARELEWFLNGGFTFFPGEEYRGLTWLLWAMTLAVILLALLMIIESYVAAGFLYGTLRVFFILIINGILALVALFTAIAVVIVVVAVLAIIFFFSVLASSGRRYRCTRCGTVFTGDHCPSCG